MPNQSSQVNSHVRDSGTKESVPYKDYVYLKGTVGSGGTLLSEVGNIGIAVDEKASNICQRGSAAVEGLAVDLEKLGGL